MKRKRKNFCPSPLLDDSPKRTKVQAQRKFAQGSNVNSPVITPIKELEAEVPRIDTLPEPVELLPIKRPNTEDFLTFLCFRGTPILPPTLNFFNTASIVDTNGQVHEIKSEGSPKNGPIDIGKCGSSSEKPFIAFGVRKRADPIVISRQMDRKRRHALAIQALRRKYQEQKMAKIRAVAISKLSEKVTNKTLVKTNTVSKTETVTKRNNTLQKIKVVATKHVKVTTQTQRTTVRPKMKQKMCLRSFRGRFVQKELPFRKKLVTEKKVNRTVGNVNNIKKRNENTAKREENAVALDGPSISKMQKVVPKIVKKIVVETSPKIISKRSSLRVTRSGKVDNNLSDRRKQKRILIQNPKTMVKPRILRNTTMKKTVLSRKKSQKAQQKMKPSPKETVVLQNDTIQTPKTTETPAETKTEPTKVSVNSKKDEKGPDKKLPGKNKLKKGVNSTNKTTELKKDFKKVTDLKKESTSVIEKEKEKKQINKSLDIRKEISKSTDIKKNVSKTVQIKRSTRISNVVEKVNRKTNSAKKTEFRRTTRQENAQTRKDNIENQTVAESVPKNKLSSSKSESKPSVRSQETKKNDSESNNPHKNDSSNMNVPKTKNKLEMKIDTIEVTENMNFPKTKTKSIEKKIDNIEVTEKPPEKPKKEPMTQKESTNNKDKKETEKDITKTKVDPEIADGSISKQETIVKNKPTVTLKSKKDLDKNDETKKETVSKAKSVKLERDVSPKTIQRPSRKTKEAAAIYMEILSHKLVNDGKIDDDNVSIDSFPELPNVKKTEQRENELKAQAKKEDCVQKDKLVAEVVETLDKKNVQEVVKKGKNAKNSEHIKKDVKLAKQTSCNVDEKIEEENKDVIIKSVTSPIQESKQSISVPTQESKQSISVVEKISVEEEKLPKELQEIIVSNVVVETDKIHDKEKMDIPETVPDNKSTYVIDKVCEEPIKVTEEPPVKEDSTNQSQKSIPETEKGNKSEPLVLEKDLKLVSNEEQKQDKTEPDANEAEIKRKNRNTILSKKGSGEDSDQSFHLNVKVPKKKVTKSKTQPKVLKVEEKIPVTLSKEISSESDESTSDVNLQTIANRQKNKKYRKKRPIKKVDENSFCDSDEEPLSKLTSKISEMSGNDSLREKTKSTSGKKEMKLEPKVKPAPEVPVVKNEPEVKESTKPKRECAKRPQNYLPMLSSSDDEDIFHGFDEKAAVKNTKTIPNTPCSHTPPLLDFLTKDIGRRWGKEKVNMSNELIEKWLKDSALAGSSIKKENDEMLKFGERIPTETPEPVETDTKKLFQIDSETSSKTNVSKIEPVEKVENKDFLKQQLDSVKPKLIFRKHKSESTPNVNAFSPENESSVYAFGEENEDLISTPFRRPSRRPSSTATSRSEDESSKNEESLKSGHFRKPSLKQEITKSQSKEELNTTVDVEESPPHFYIPQKPSKSNKPTLKTVKSSEKIFDSDDYKYKVPSSPSASSSSSTKLYKRQPPKQKTRTSDTISPIYMSDFPKRTEPAKLVEAPTFHPSDQEFQDPLEYIERIRHKAEQFGICRIVPPSSFKPECKVSDDMRFTAYNQYVHKMLHRWGPNFKELMAIKKHLETQNISIAHPPWIGGMEIDLPRLYQTVQNLGGLKEVIEKKKWPRVSEFMKIPKSAQDRVTKLDDIYCKYLLPYDTLSPAEREKLFDEVETEWAKRESRNLVKAQSKTETNASVDVDTESEPEDNEAEECTTKGRNMALNGFYRIARNTMSMYFKNQEPSAQEVEERYWNYVMTRQNYICVHSGSIDSGSWGYGFPVAKNSPFAKHPWNLKVLTNNNGSFLKSLGPVMGVTVPTLHVGMVFSSCCWYRDPHGLPWIEYLHTGASKIWYGIPNSTSDVFHSTLKKIVPNYCRNKELWLPSDTVMVPPSLLVGNNVSLCRIVQDPGQFIVVFPKVFTSSICTGYVVSESVYFAPSYWLKMAKGLFEALRNSNEPSMFSLDRLLVSLAQEMKCNIEILRQAVPHVEELYEREKEGRKKLKSLGKLEEEKLPEPEANKNKRKKMHQGEEGDYECEICRTSLFVSMLFDTQEGITYCLDHGFEAIEQKKSQLDKCKLMFTYEEEELGKLCETIKTTIETKLQKKGCK